MVKSGREDRLAGFGVDVHSLQRATSIVVPATALPGPPTSVGIWGGGLQSAVRVRTGDWSRPPPSAGSIRRTQVRCTRLPVGATREDCAGVDQPQRIIAAARVSVSVTGPETAPSARTTRGRNGGLRCLGRRVGTPSTLLRPGRTALERIGGFRDQCCRLTSPPPTGPGWSVHFINHAVGIVRTGRRSWHLSGCSEREAALWVRQRG